MADEEQQPQGDEQAREGAPQAQDAPQVREADTAEFPLLDLEVVEGGTPLALGEQIGEALPPRGDETELPELPPVGLKTWDQATAQAYGYTAPWELVGGLWAYVPTRDGARLLEAGFDTIDKALAFMHRHLVGAAHTDALADGSTVTLAGDPLPAPGDDGDPA